MTDDEVDRLIYEAFDFAKQMAADPQHASLRVIPVVVGVEVCTVQQEGEPIGPTMDRAIRAQNLVPLYLWPFPTAVERQPINPLLINFMMKLPRIRVEDVDEGRALMRVCSICLRNPRMGTQISLLPCHHAFHSHCVVRWLENSKLCPLCHFPAHDYMFHEPRYLERNP
ncbi:hypothetical protein Pfo_005808 [Paulownia fortunei]|nr:hypothetical protein Pfo_005808 [Paulownia fortunei]